MEDPVLWILFIFSVQSVVLGSFTPTDSFLMDCGGSNSIELDDGRVFIPDTRISAVSLSPFTNSVVSENKMSSILYNTARVFREASKYTIRMNQIGRYWVRLHFYPVENSLYDLNSAVFSVTASGFTLLHGFSFSHMKQNSPLLKEYVVEVFDETSKSLVVTLSPSNGSIAFLNGLEIVPADDAKLTSAAITVPSGSSDVKTPKRVAYETVYRINMGGPVLTPKNDSLWRFWEPDQPFLVNPASAQSVMVNPDLIKYTDGVTSVSIAPSWVYATAQEMADANVGNQRFNISWVFEVEASFEYRVRMHFCDIVSFEVSSLVFEVYINNQSALTSFDISSKTNALLTAYFIDLITYVPKDTNQILVQVGPHAFRNIPPNAILNGLEIFKISNSFDSLDYTDPNAPKTKKWVLVLISSSSAGLAILVFISGALFLYLRRQNKEKDQPVNWLPLPTQAANSNSKISTGSFASTAHSHGLGRVLSFSEIREATKNFDDSLIMGVGGFGKVYKGILENGVVVAVKRANPRSKQGLTEFRTEIMMLSKLRHRHLVSLIGYCEEQNEMILVYEFMSGGPLRKHLYGSSEFFIPPLTWKQRLEICIGAAKGLHYLHTGAAETIIHRDVKTTNILLDENLTAKVADFGLSKLGPTLDQTHVSTAVKGSFGYLDPEYFRRQQLTEKSDVYSFGVVLMEVLCGRSAINPALPREQVNIAEWGMHWQKRGLLEKIIDPNLVRSINLDSLRKFGETAEKCLAENGIDRPTMGDVLWNLEYALQLQVSSLKSLSSENTTSDYISDIPEWIPHIESAESRNTDLVVDENSETCTSSGVFSQILNPKGR